MKHFTLNLKEAEKIMLILLTLTLSLMTPESKGQISEVENIPATCPESSDGSLTVRMQGGVAPYDFQWSNGVTSNSNQEIDGYTFIGNYENHSYYVRNSGINSFEAASLEARAYGGYLVSINSPEENAAIAAMTAYQNIYIGLTDKDQEGTFIWDSGEPVNYTNWG